MPRFKHIPTTSQADDTENFQQLEGMILWGRGTPQNRVAAPVGAIYLREDGGVKSTLYVKEKAVGAMDMSGWAAK